MNVTVRTSPAHRLALRLMKVAPTTRAIRVALFGSAVMIGLGGPALAQAGTCTADDPGAPNTIACNGTFTTSLPGLYDPLVDLTLVVGGDAPTSVVPTAGSAGVDITSQAGVGVTTHADITTIGADGVHVETATSATIDNDGVISTAATVDGGSAIGILAGGDIGMTNDGVLDTFSTADVAPATAVTATSTSGTGNVRFDNLADGIVSAHTSGYASAATGVAITTAGGAGEVNNFGDISATATSATPPTTPNGYYFTVDVSSATGISIRSGGDATVNNSGSISASNRSQSLQDAAATGVSAYSLPGAGTAAVINTQDGTITATGGLTSTGVRAISGGGDVTTGTTGTVANAGSITSEALGMGASDGYTPFATTVSVGVLAANVDNSGQITAIAHGDAGDARAVWGSQSIVNTGDILADASDGTGGSARGLFVSSVYSGDVTVDNSGDVMTTAGGAMTGFSGLVIGSDLTFRNSGTIANTAAPDRNGIWNALGVQVSVLGKATIVNSGDITLQCGGNQCTGMDILAGGDLMIDNSGTITLTGTYFQNGIVALQLGGSVDINNSGLISVDTSLGLLGATGIRTTAYNNYASEDRTTTIVNSGTVSAVVNALPGSSYLPLRGQIATAIEAASYSGAIDITNTGTLDAQSYSYSSVAGGAVGIKATSAVGQVGVTNSGSITARIDASSVYGGGLGVGITAYSGRGSVNIANAGTVDVTAISNYASDDGQVQALGVAGFSVFGDVTINNAIGGAITAEGSTLLFNTAAAYGAYAQTVTGNLSIGNDGSISAIAGAESSTYLNSYGQTTAMGISAVNQFGDHTAVVNRGDVSASATTQVYGASRAFGINVYASSPYATADVANTGTITATARADNHDDAYDAATAAGIAISNRYGGQTLLSNAGAITATASSMLSSRAMGVSFDGLSLSLDSGGRIAATATADGAMGTALATGVSATGGVLAVDLATGSTLTAAASGFDGTAIGLLLSGETVTAGNAGMIDATFAGGAAGRAYGALLAGNGALAFTNSGAISATGPAQAVGVALSSDASTSFTNSGSVVAQSGSGNAIALLTGDSADRLANSGRIVGAVVMAGGDDAVDNSGSITGQLLMGDGTDRFDNRVAGTWTTSGLSEFGAGDDALVNAGTIHLQDATLSFGASGDSGNRFDNTGLITVAGGANSIDLGSQNQGAFTNAGAISFVNGAVGDGLSVIGDFAGTGSLAMDVSPLNGTGDLLDISGDVATGSVTTVNTHVIDLQPTASVGSVAVVRVGGDSTAGSFVLGDVTFDSSRSFLTVQAVGIRSAIDTSNAIPDVFSIDFSVGGLSETGALSAAFLPAVQRLMTSQVGTWRQRMGLINTLGQGPSVWARAFSDDGTVSPSHQDSNFGQGGRLAFDQRSHGQEVGVDYAFNEVLSAGLLVGQASAAQRLNGAGRGTSRLDGNTRGLYATWLSPAGFYADVSYRRMSFDASLWSAAGNTRSGGKADAFNIEAGRAWTLGNGVKIEPQLQYTRATVSDFDAFRGAMTGFRPDDGASSIGRAGVAVRKGFAAGQSVWTPYVALSAVREFDGKNAFSIDAAFFGSTSTRGTSLLAEGGIGLQTGHLSLTGGANWQDGGSLQSVVGGQLNVRYSW